MGANSLTPSRSGTIEAQVAALAARQYGVVTRGQLADIGLGRSAIDRRLHNGRLHLVHRGVYGVGFRPVTSLSLAMAAVLACGPDALLSHRSAAAVWGIGPAWHGPTEVLAPRRRRHAGITIHQTLRPDRRDRAGWNGLPVTTVARTLVDLGDVLSERALTRAANEALVQRLVDRRALAAQLARSPGRRAVGLLRRHTDATTGPTRSAFEDRFLELIDTHGLPRPEVNATIAGHEVDALWRSRRLIVELDGRAFHDTPERFESDRARDATLIADGYRVIRITWRRLSGQPEREAAILRKLLRVDER